MVSVASAAIFVLPVVLTVKFFESTLTSVMVAVTSPVFSMEMAAAPGVLPSATEPKFTLPTVRLGVPAVAETVKVTSACAVLPLS